MKIPLEMHVNDSAWALAVSGRVVVTCWRTAVTRDRVREVDRVLTRLMPRLGGQQYASVTLIEPGLELALPEDARTESTNLQKKFAAQACCSAYLVYGEGFLAASVRTLTAGLSLLTRSPHPIKVFSNEVSCADWVSFHTGRAARELEQVFSETRRLPAG